MGNDISAKLNIDASAAVSALRTAAKALRDYNAVSDKTSAEAKAQAASLKTIASAAVVLQAAYDKTRAASSKMAQQAIKDQADIRNAELKAANDRKNDRVVTAAKSDAISTVTSAKVDVSQSQVSLNNSRAQLVATQQLIALQQAEIKNEAMIAAERDRSAQAAARLANTVQAGVQKTQAAQRTQTDEAQNQLFGLQYSLQNVSSATRNVGLAAIGVAGASIGIAANWQRDFANVKRTVNDANFDVLNKQLIELSQTIPVTYGDLTNIATAAGQLGIQGPNIANFTKTVAEFSATSNVSIDDTATAFGRLNSLITGPGGVNNNFEGLADSILKVGVNSVATESQIVNIATQISSITGAANFGYKATVGLAGALASVGAPPELSRGVITRTFGVLSRAISEGGVKLDQFGALAGMSGKEFAKAWSTDAPGTFEKFVAGLRAQGSNAEQSLRNLGITSVRDVPILLRLANAADSAGNAGQLLTQTMRDANDAGGELNRQYGIVADTITAKLQVLMNTIESIAGGGGMKSLGVVGFFLDEFTKSLKSFADFAGTDVGQVIVGIGIAVTGLIGVLTLAASVVAGGAAAYVALIAVMSRVQALTASTAVTTEGLAVAEGEAAGAAGAQALSFGALNTTLAATGPLGEKVAFAIRGIGLAMKALTVIGILASLPVVFNAANDGFDNLTGKVHTFDAEIDRLSQKNALSGLGNLQDYSKYDDATLALVRGMDNLGLTVSTTSADVKRLDDQFTDLAKSGSYDQIAEGLTSVMKKTGENLPNILRDFSGLKGELDSLGISATVAGDGTVKLAGGAADSAAAMTALGDASDDASTSVDDFSQATATADGAFIDLQQALADMGEAQKAAFNSANPEAAAGAYDEFVKQAGFDLDGFIQKLQEQAQAQQDWEKNVLTLRSKGVSDIGIQMLEGLGPAGAKAAAALAGAGQDAIDKFNTAIEEGSPEATAQFAATVKNASPQFWAAANALGAGAVAEIVQQLADGSASVDDIIKKYNLNIPLTLSGVDQAQSEIKDLTGDRETGIHPTVNSTDYYIANGLLDEAAAPRLADLQASANPDDRALAQRLLDTLANARTAQIIANAQNVGPTQTNLDTIAANRQAYIYAHADTQQARWDLDRLTSNRTIYINTVVNPAGGARESGLPGGYTGGKGSKILGFATGGRKGYKVPGVPSSNPTVDSYPAMLRPKEWVINQTASQFYGDDFMNAINNRSLQPNGGGSYVPTRGTASSRQSSNVAAQQVELSPYDRALLKSINDNIGVTIPVGPVTAATNARNTKGNRLGAG